MKDDYLFWVKHKEEAEKFFGRNWQTIRVKANEKGCFSDRTWTEEDISELKNNYLYWMEHRPEAEKFFSRTFNAIQEKAIKEGCVSDYFWAEAETSELKNRYRYWMEHRPEAEKFFSRTFNAIQEKAIKEGCVSDYFWAEAETSELKNRYRYWSKHKKEAEEFFGRNWQTIRVKANKEGCISDYFWTDDEFRVLKNNYEYWSKHKQYAESFFGRAWQSIAMKAWEEGLKLAFKSNTKILTHCIDMINGLLLSDGHIQSNSNLTGHYDQGCIKKEWLMSIKKEFDKYGVICDIKDHAIRPPYEHNNKIYVPSPSYTLTTRNYVEFRKLREKWYPEDKKIVPKDIELTPECVANWYLGDGSITRNKKTKMFLLRLSTNGFPHDDVTFLSDLLNDTLDMYSRTYIHGVQNKGLVIYVSRQKDVKVFINYIRDFWIRCYDHKFPADLLHDERRDKNSRTTS